eukprot:2543997-Alexandrium_andersonii.AAC.1
MSASLVGSEMCIRDRLDTQERPPPFQACTDRNQGCMRRAYIISRHQKAVSYTHLTLPTICSV